MTKEKYLKQMKKKVPPFISEEGITSWFERVWDDAYLAGRESILNNAIEGYIIGNSYFKEKNIELIDLTPEQYEAIGDFGDRVKLIVIRHD